MTRTILKILIIAVTLISCSSSKSDYELMTNEVTKGNWGYSILLKGQEIIHQDYIPCINGNIHFSSKRDASKIGALVIRKMEEGQLPIITALDLETFHIKIENE